MEIALPFARAQVTLFFRTTIPRTAAEQAALRFAVSQALQVKPRDVRVIEPLPSAAQLTLELPADRALALLALHTSSDPVLDHLQVADMVLAESGSIQAYYFQSAPSRERNRDAAYAIIRHVLVASGYPTDGIRRVDFDRIIDQILQGENGTHGAVRPYPPPEGALLIPAIAPVVIHLLADVLLSDELNVTLVLGDDLPLMAPSVSTSELAVLVRNTGIQASDTEIGVLAEAINSAIVFQLKVPLLDVDRQRLASVRVKLATYFSIEELRDLCFDLGVDFDDLPGLTKSSKARELIAFCERHGRTAVLLATARTVRPHVLW